MEKEIRYCKNCGKELNRRDRVYCSNQCQHDYQYKQYIQRWKQGLETGIRGKYQLSCYIHRYIMEKFDNKCHRCGWCEVNPTTNKIPLEIDHIDGNYLNNNEDNLELLCPNCHSLTPTYKGANKGYGRKDRHKYYL